MFTQTAPDGRHIINQKRDRNRLRMRHSVTICGPCSTDYRQDKDSDTNGELHRQTIARGVRDTLWSRVR